MNIEAPKGMSIYNAVAYAKEVCIENRLSSVMLEFNGLGLYVDKNSLDVDICTIYSLMSELRQLKGK